MSPVTPPRCRRRPSRPGSVARTERPSTGRHVRARSPPRPAASSALATQSGFGGEGGRPSGRCAAGSRVGARAAGSQQRTARPCRAGRSQPAVAPPSTCRPRGHASSPRPWPSREERPEEVAEARKALRQCRSLLGPASSEEELQPST
eukprot:scaffold46533_cov66-Phaeocystis_antarctica.AAC.9